jgi:5'(3')-deoxyribonucleotidase
MIKVKDINGAEIKGAVKTKTGSIAFLSDSTYHRYIKQKEIALRKTSDVEELRNQITQLSGIVDRLLKEKNGES